jgi:HK97 family phage portal protein
VALLNRAIKNARAMMRAQEWGDSSIPPNSMATSPSLMGGAGTEAAALGISTVLSCVKALHDDVTTLGIFAYEGQRNGPHSPVAKQPQIVLEPFGPDLDVLDGIGQLVVSRAFRGNAYMYVVSRDPYTGLPSQLMILHPDLVHPVKKSGKKLFKIGQQYFDSTEIIHITGMMLPGGVAGVDVLTAQRINFDLALKVGQYADGFFGGGGSPAGVISVPGQGDRTKAREVRDSWEAGHAGVLNAHRPAVLFGAATWTPMTVTPENAQFLATRKFLREEICGLFSVPLQRIQAITENASQGGGRGLDALDAGYVKHGLLPLVTGIENVFSKMLPGGEGSWVGFDLNGFLRASAEIRARVAQVHRVTGVRTPDEIRAEEGWQPLPDGKGTNPFTPLNSNASPTGGADNAPDPGSSGGSQ